MKLESSDGEELTDQDKEEKVKTDRIKTPSGWKCVPCHARYTDREEFIAHMAKQHNKVSEVLLFLRSVIPVSLVFIGYSHIHGCVCVDTEEVSLQQM